MSLEEVLREIERTRGGGQNRDPEMYFVSIFGQPGAAPWGWRFEGHHLSLNFTSAGGTADAGDDAVVLRHESGRSARGAAAGPARARDEEDLGRELVRSLDDAQRREAIIAEQAPKDILNVPGRAETRPQGLPQSRMNAAQTELLTKLVKEYLFRHRRDLATAEWSRLEKAGLGRLHFAWAGGIERGQPHYYRVQGDGFALEYDNTQNNANHVHSVWRDLTRDFGEDLLAKHYEQAHPAGPK